jgi:hypothetical protein
VDRIATIVDGLPEGTMVITGGCLGGDALVARLARARGLKVLTILPANHKEVDPEWREHCTEFYQMPPGTSYRDRNTRIVVLSRRMYGLADGPTNGVDRGSGTWMTIRIAQRRGVPIQVEVLHA